jgi:hypothetical protein
MSEDAAKYTVHPVTEAATPQPPTPRQARRGRLTVVEQLYHQDSAGNATPVTTTFCRHLQSDEQPYSRRITVGPTWQHIDHGWLDKQPIGMLVVANNGKPGDGSNVELGVYVGFSNGTPMAQHVAVILPGEALRLQPAYISDLRLRCTGPNPVSCTTTLLPS